MINMSFFDASWVFENKVHSWVFSVSLLHECVCGSVSFSPYRQTGRTNSSIVLFSEYSIKNSGSDVKQTRVTLSSHC